MITLDDDYKILQDGKKIGHLDMENLHFISEPLIEFSASDLIQIAQIIEKIQSDRYWNS